MEEKCYVCDRLWDGDTYMGLKMCAGCGGFATISAQPIKQEPKQKMGETLQNWYQKTHKFVKKDEN